jgi:energy-converting hydrogenase Eha subunit A
MGVGAMLVGTSGLAFAGELPAPAQRIVHTVFASIGLDIPTPEAPASPAQPSSVGFPTATKGAAISGIAKNHLGRAGVHGATVSAVASDGHSQAGQPHGQSHQPNGESDQPHGQSDQPHGQSGQPHGQSGQPHGQSGQPHGHSDATHPAPGKGDR